MNISASLAILALTAMVVFYALEECSRLGRLDSPRTLWLLPLAFSLSAAGHLGWRQSGSPLAALRRWYVRRTRERRVQGGQTVLTGIEHPISDK